MRKSTIPLFSETYNIPTIMIYNFEKSKENDGSYFFIEHERLCVVDDQKLLNKLLPIFYEKSFKKINTVLAGLNKCTKSFPTIQVLDEMHKNMRDLTKKLKDEVNSLKNGK